MKKINTDRVVSVSAFIVSIATLFLIFYQTNLIRKEQKASVLPSLTIGYSVDRNNQKIKEGIWVSNQGLGPAFIEQVAIIEKGKLQTIDPFGFLKSNYDAKEISFVNRIFPGRIIPANDGFTIIEKNTDSSSKIILSNVFEYPYEINQMPSDKEEKAIIQIVYKSIYGDKWKISSDKTTPIKID